MHSDCFFKKKVCCQSNWHSFTGNLFFLSHGFNISLGLWCSTVASRCFYLYIFLMIIYFWERERERDAEGEGDRNSECALHWWWGLNPRMVRLWHEPKLRVRHLIDWATQAPLICIFLSPAWDLIYIFFISLILFILSINLCFWEGWCFLDARDTELNKVPTFRELTEELTVLPSDFQSYNS